MTSDRKPRCESWPPDYEASWPPDSASFRCFYEKGHPPEQLHRNADGDEW